MQRHAARIRGSSQDYMVSGTRRKGSGVQFLTRTSGGAGGEEANDAAGEGEDEEIRLHQDGATTMFIME